jgi:aryl-alcohol dehydrogenase-like predicted oxidoreductase
MTFGESKDPMSMGLGTIGQDVAGKLVNSALDAGINFFDTANMYSMGTSEEMLGKALGGRRQDVVVATKVYFKTGPGINDLGTSRVAILREVERSLKRMGTDYIDLYQVHSFDLTTPLEETLSTLNDLIHTGKVRYIGLSNFSAWQIAKAAGIAERKGFEQFCSVQAYYSLVGRELEREILPVARDLGMGVMVWSPLAGGFLSGKYTRDSEGEGRRTRFNFPPIDKERGYDIVDLLSAVAKDHQVSVARVALSWLLHQAGVTSIIIGARRMEQLEDNLEAVNLELSEEELKRIDEVSSLAPEYPQWMPPIGRETDLEALMKELT